MKFTYTSIIILILTANLLVSDDKNSFGRLMEYAHPTPVLKADEYPAIPLAKIKGSSIFLNVNTIADEPFAQRMQNESSIAVNPTNPLNLIASSVDYRDNSSTWVYVSHDGGLNWQNINLGKPFKEWRSTNDPSVAFNNEGIGYLVYGGFGNRTDSNGVISGENGVFFARSIDEGKTWEAHIPVIVHLGTQTMDSTFEDKYYISVDNSKDSPYYKDLYIPWKRVTPRDSATQIVISKSTDGGTSWSIPVYVSNRLPGSSEDTTFGQSFPLASTDPDGTVYVVWNHGVEHGVGFNSSNDGGKTFGTPRIIHNYNIFGATKLLEGQGYRHTVKGKVRAEAYPSMAVDIFTTENKGNIYVCWAADNYPNIYFSKSRDKGLTWSEPVIVHSDTTNDQFWPWISVDPLSGNIAIMYFDSRKDSSNILVECWVSFSSDAGDTWIDRQATDKGSDLRLNPFGGNSFAGDYSGVAFYDGIIYPSWVDMRSAVADLFDSDVYTAIVNTKSPNPPDNFAANTIPDEPERIKLTWETPEERAFGQKLELHEFNYSLYRDSSYITTIPSSITEYFDESLEPYREYKYEIRTVANADSSITVASSAFAAGSQQPGQPEIISVTPDASLNCEILLKLPTLRSDNITSLVNMNKANIYFDNKLYFTKQLLPSDTGKVIKLTTVLPEKGYYRIQATVSDTLHITGFESKESELSNMIVIYAGPVESILSENFDSQSLPRYYISGAWGRTSNISYSAPNCITESPEGNYLNNSRDTLRLFPIKCSERINISFKHIAEIKAKDYGIITYSYDMIKWNSLASFWEESYPSWGDDQLTMDDWKEENFTIPHSANCEIYIQFIFISNAISQRDGWYIDDIKLNSAVSVHDNNFSSELNIYPNPAANYLNIVNDLDINNIQIINMLGEDALHYNPIIINPNKYSVNISSLQSGAYILVVNNTNGTSHRRIFIVNR